MLPSLATLAVSPGNVLVRCPECASLFRKASPTGCTNCGGKRKREEEEKKACGCDDDDVPDPNDPNISDQWKNAWLQANGYSTGLSGLPEPWMVEAVKRKKAKMEKESEGEDAKDCGCDADEEIVVPNYDDPNDPNMTEEWLTAFWVANGGREPLGWRNPKRSRMIHAIENKKAGCGCDDPDQPQFQSGCREEDCEPVYQSLGGDNDEEEGSEEESEDESEGEGDDVGDWRDDANFDYYRAVGRPPYTP